VNFREGPGTRSRRSATVLDITPLVDVVFQLLIFFLLTSSYVTQQPAAASNDSPQVPVELPESSLPAEPSRFDDLLIAVDAQGDIYIGNDERIGLEALADRLARTANENPNTVVLIRGDQAVPYGRIAQVMAIARQSRLRISAVLRDGG
jgi:biopolymer transport protein TolR